MPTFWIAFAVEASNHHNLMLLNLKEYSIGKSPHPGTAGMGELLTIELGWTLVCVLLVMPALLGEPERLGAEDRS